MDLTSGHKRSNSDPGKRRLKENCKDNSFEDPHPVTLIMQLEKRLQDQFVVRRALEKALGYTSSAHDIANENSMPKPAKELIKEIAILELEVVYLEQYLLSLYRKAFDQHVSSLYPCSTDEGLKSPLIKRKLMFLEVSGLDMTPKRENSVVRSSPLFSRDSLCNMWTESVHTGGAEKILDSGIHRSHSSLSQRSAWSTRTSSKETITQAVRACHSQPLSMMEHSQISTSNVISLAEHLGTRISDHVPETPNRLSENLIKCMISVYCKLANPPLEHNGLPSSPISSVSSVSAFSPQGPCDTWSPRYTKDSSFDGRLDNRFHVEGLKEFSGPFSTMVEIPCICTDREKLSTVEPMLENVRALVCRLEKVDPKKMKEEEKLAFWINIHNALVMHAFLAYGIPQNYLKRVSLLLKAAYNIGGRKVTADTIQRFILGCRTPRPGQWLWLLFSPRTKFKGGDGWQSYAVDHGEPLLHFALCSGSHSDPAVRVYTAKRVLQELEVAKQEYIRATFGVRKEQKILLPKIVDSFTKASGLCPVVLVEMIQHCMPESLRKSIRKCQQGISRKSIEWVPHNFAFRYLISKELVNMSS